MLIAVGRLLGARRVLELGCGEFSTHTFLDETGFPNLEHLRSLETDALWLQRLADATRNDPRITLTHVETSMATAVDKLPLADFDMVFVDDSMETGDRAETIRAVARNANDRTVAVIHDFETPEYRAAAEGFRHRFTFTALRPNTGVAWNGARVSPLRLRLLNRLLWLKSFSVDPGDRKRWAAVVAKWT